MSVYPLPLVRHTLNPRVSTAAVLIFFPLPGLEVSPCSFPCFGPVRATPLLNHTTLPVRSLVVAINRSALPPRTGPHFGPPDKGFG